MRRILFAALLCVPALAQAAPEAPATDLLKDIKLDLHGYARTRYTLIKNLYDTDVVPNTEFTTVPVRSTSYFVSRVRLEPTLSLEKIAKLSLQADVFDNVVWGDNDAVTAAPLFAVNPSNTNWNGEQVPTLQVKRAWIEVNLPVGVLRVGRMASHWGMGLLANGGDGLDLDFGDKNYGSTNDRILFATRPLQIFRTLRGDPNPESNFLVAYAYDKIVEEPCLVLEGATPNCQYLGPQGFFDKFHRLRQGNTERGERPLGNQGWLSSADNDVNEHILVMLYANDKLDYLRVTDEIRAGVYMVFRDQGKSFTKLAQTGQVDKGSTIRIYDGWLKLRLGMLYAETEGYIITGDTTGGVPLGELVKEASIVAGVGRLGVMTRMVDGILELGYSQGDEDLGDNHFTQRATHPDYGVGLLMYREVLRQRTAERFELFGATALQSNGGVANSKYVNPRVRVRPLAGSGLEIVAGLLMGWINEKDDYIYAMTSGTYLGTELDVAIKLNWAQDHLQFVLEGGLLNFGDALSDYHSSWASTFQSRLALVF